ncbi:FtsX-like permease family protein, partial [candidate division KSB1 bacterium]|nr:FtsX-like permease family protein [candidate division KSB1 bacterium]
MDCQNYAQDSSKFKEKIMLQNYIKITLRYFLKNKLFSIVNIIGLTIGFACFILLALYVIDELNFDRFHRDSDRIYRIIQHIHENEGSSRKIAAVAPRIGPAAVEQFPEVQSQARLIEIGRVTIGNEPLNRDYERIWIANANFFQFFDFEFVYGDEQTVLTKPDNLVITESIARKYFGETNVVGRRLYTNVFEATIAGVIKDFPANSHIKINTIHAEPTWQREISQWNEWVNSNWTSNSFITYLKMKPEFDKKGFEEKLTGLVTSNYDDQISYTSSFSLQPLHAIHLYSGDIQGGMNVNAGNPLYVYMFSIIGLLILSIACFNYMNLSTAAASRRTREVSMRKTLGAGKNQLIFQFTGESLILSLLSFLLAVILLELTLPIISGFIGKTLTLPLDNILLVTGLFLIVIFSGIISSLYPTFFLSKVNPATALKKEIKLGGGRLSLRTILVVAQFAVSIIMISATLVIYRQLDYLRQKDPGFQLENLLVVDINSGALRSQFESIKREFNNLSDVRSVTVSSRVPGEWKVFPVANVEHRRSAAKGQMIFVGVDENFLDTYRIKLVNGRALRNDVADSNAVMLTESSVKLLGLKEPIGEILDIKSTIWAGDLNEQDYPYSPRVVGIVKDFHFQSFREKMRPLMLASHRNPIHSIDYYTLRIRTSNWQQTLANLQSINQQFDPENPMEYTFLGNRFEQFYEADWKRGQLFLVTSGLVILIAAMGLFALASFAIEKRIKEIGVRKVLGANILDIIWLLNREFTLLVGIAFIA